MSKWEIRKDDVLGESVYKHVHESGLEIYFLPKKDFSKKYAYFGTKYGSFNNCFELNGERHCMPKGIAHFLEHKIFEDPERNIFDKFASLGASVNAFTSFNSTVYHFSTVDMFEESLAELLKFVQRVNLTEENVEKEKGIIVQELKSYEDDPEYMVFFNTMRALYGEHPIRDDIGGYAESVVEITKEQLETCYEAFYAPANMALIVSGDLDADSILEVVERELQPSFINRKAGVSEKLPVESMKVHMPYHESYFEVPIPLFEIGIKGHVNFESTKELLLVALSMKIIMDTEMGRSSNFYKELYDEGIINSSFGMDFTFGENYAYYIVGGESREPEVVLERLKKEVLRIREEGIDLEGFERIKKKMIGRLISSANSVQYLSSAYVNYFMKDLDLFEYIRAISETTHEHGLKYLKETFHDDHLALSVVKQEVKS